MPANASAKDDLRAEVRSSLSQVPSETLQAASAGISQSIILPSGANCALFAGTSREPQLLSLLSNSNCSWFLPRVQGPGIMSFHKVTPKSILTAGVFGILEPQAEAPQVSPEDLDLILCPGIAFSTSGMRLGQGGGYYDRYLPKATNARLLGIAFDQQVYDSIPSDPHDIPMHEIITERQHLRISNQEPPN